MGWVSHPTVLLLWFKPRVTCCHPASVLPKLAMALGLSFPSRDGLGCPCPLGLGVSLAPPRAAPQLWQSLGRMGRLASLPRPPAQAAPPLTHPDHRGIQTLVPKQTEPTEAPHHPWETTELLGLAFQLSRALASLRASALPCPAPPPSTLSSPTALMVLSASNVTPALLPLAFAHTVLCLEALPTSPPSTLPLADASHYSGVCPDAPPPGRLPRSPSWAGPLLCTSNTLPLRVLTVWLPVRLCHQTGSSSRWDHLKSLMSPERPGTEGLQDRLPSEV